jgi:RNA polymerase sigma-70 factor, ECF subfamily
MTDERRLVEPHRLGIGFDAFYREHYPAVVGLVYTLTGSRNGAEDIAQEAFLRAHRHWDEVAHYERPGGWVRVVALNLARGRLRRLAAETRALGRFAGMAVTAFPELEPADEAFWSAVRALPRRQCEVVALHYLEDMSVADVATLLGIADSSVRNSLAQARSTLAKTIGGEK